MTWLRWILCFAALVYCGAFTRADQPLKLQENIEYAKFGDVSLKLDAFVPPGAGPFPTCILVHGGGFTKGTKQSYITPIFAPLAEAGFTFFTIDYRLAPTHRWPACADDVETAVRWVKAHAAEYKVDVNRIALIGESAGGHLVSYVGAVGKGETAVAAVVPFYAPHDLDFRIEQREKPAESMIALFDIKELNDETRKLVHRASVSERIHAGMPPYLLISGDRDNKVPYEQSTGFRERMLKLGNTCDLITIPGGGHGMGGWAKLNSDYEAQMIAWLRKTLQ